MCVVTLVCVPAQAGGMSHYYTCDTVSPAGRPLIALLIKLVSQSGRPLNFLFIRQLGR